MDDAQALTQRIQFWRVMGRIFAVIDKTIDTVSTIDNASHARRQHRQNGADTRQ